MKNQAERMAQALSARFLAQGSYGSAVAMKGSVVERILPVSATTEPDVDDFIPETAFAGLEVQSVGYEAGAKAQKVHIYVSRASARAIQSLPTADEQVTIEVNRIGKLLVRPEQASSVTNRGRIFEHKQRIACGSSCAPSGESYAGTMGALVRKDRKEGSLYILSNNHVLAACNHTAVGMPILAPANIDASPTARAPGEVARHAEICELRSGEPSLVQPCLEDVAIARVSNPDAVSSWQGDDQQGFDTPSRVVPLKAGMRVQKFGRTSGRTTGTVEARLNTLTPIPYKSRLFSATVWFKDVWTVAGDEGESFALPGDSGSLVATEDGTASVGLVFAATPSVYGLIIPMNHLISCFGKIELVNKHGI
jgi:hypothetical protein